MDDKPLSPPIAKQEDDFDDSPSGSPKTKQADDKADRPLSSPITNKNFSAANLDNITSKLKDIKGGLLECNMHLQRLSAEVKKFKADMDQERIVYKIEAIVEKKGKSERKENPKVPFSLAKSVYQRKQSQVYVQAEERLTQQCSDFKHHKTNILNKEAEFIKFHLALQTKVKFMENLTPEMFCNYGKIERSKILEQILLSRDECYIERKCGQYYDAIIRDNHLLRITYGFPEKPKQVDIDDIENKFHNYKRLCDKLNYSFY